MKTIGLLGGMTCESSHEYYRLINKITRSKLGGIHNAHSVMISVDFAVIEPLMEAGKWDEIMEILVECAQNVEKAGADFLVLCTNTMHKLVDEMQIHIEIPILNIIDAAAERIKEQELHTIGLLGTRFTMEENFYKDRLKENYDLEVLIPAREEREVIHRIIANELSIGKTREPSKKIFWDIMNRLADRGAQGIILGCTEIPLLVNEKEGNIPLFDTTLIHATAAVEYALA